MNYEQGLLALRKLAEDTNWFADFLVYEARLLENLEQERLYSSSEQSRATRMQVIDQLNRLAYQHFKTSFNDLCRGSTPNIPATSKSRFAVDNKQVIQKASSSDAVSASSPINIFIGYSHKDKRYLTELRTHLALYAHFGAVNAWDDTMILPGAKWHDEITNAIQSAQVAILLVSADFLASDFIVRKELPPLLKSAEQDGIKILCIILRSCGFLHTDLAQFKSINDPSKPLSNMKQGERDEIWNNTATYVNDLSQEASY